MSGYASYDDALNPKYGDPFPVPITMATAETLKGYGTIVTDFEKTKVEITPWPVKGWRKLCPNTGTQGGECSGDFCYKWVGDQCTAVNNAVGGVYVTGRLPTNVSPSNRTHVLVREANYHPDGWRKLCPDTGTLGGECSGDFCYKWVGDQCTAVNNAVGGVYVTGRLPTNVSPSNRTHVLVREANYHPDGGQVFFPQNSGPFVALLALPGDDIKLNNFQAFYFDGSFGVQIHADIWHQPVYPINDEAVFLGKQGAVYACVAVDTVDEFGKYLLVPLTKPA